MRGSLLGWIVYSFYYIVLVALLHLLVQGWLIYRSLTVLAKPINHISTLKYKSPPWDLVGVSSPFKSVGGGRNELVLLPNRMTWSMDCWAWSLPAPRFALEEFSLSWVVPGLSRL